MKLRAPAAQKLHEEIHIRKMEDTLQQFNDTTDKYLKDQGLPFFEATQHLQSEEVRYELTVDFLVPADAP